MKLIIIACSMLSFSITHQINSDSIIVEKDLNQSFSRAPKNIDNISNEENSDEKQIAQVVDSSSSNDSICPEMINFIRVFSNGHSNYVLPPEIDSINRLMRKFHRERLKVDTSSSGSICIRFLVSSEGRAGNIEIIHNTLNDSVVKDKLLKTFSECRFKLTDEIEGNEATYKIIFLTKSQKILVNGKATFGLIVVIALTTLSFVLFRNFQK